jgi:diaminobutyrate-2-oxoglutarate transaminase
MRHFANLATFPDTTSETYLPHADWPAADRRESNVRYYSRLFPTVFERAQGAHLFDVRGRRYIDFLSGCGTLNYGHNHPHLIAPVRDYLASGGVLHSLDMMTTARQAFLERLFEVVLEPRGLDYRVQFPGPTGTNAVEAALKLARKVTQRRTVVAFSNAFHGVTAGSLAVTASAAKRAAMGLESAPTIRMPYDGFLGGGELELMEAMLTRPGSGLGAPAAFILETVQGEGGVSVASPAWLRGVERLARRLGALLIVDDVQAGCGRCSNFFSFERANIRPDLVCLAKSLSGLGLPLSLVLISPEYDVWAPGEHNGTFRGNNLAFVAARAALDFWRQPEFLDGVDHNATIMRRALEQIGGAVGKGLGMMAGFDLGSGERAAAVQRRCFEQGLMLETCGPRAEVIKVMPPLNIEPETLTEGLEVLSSAIGSLG